MSELYFIARADDCIALARSEADAEMQAMLLDLAQTYRALARFVMRPYRAH